MFHRCVFLGVMACQCGLLLAADAAPVPASQPATPVATQPATQETGWGAPVNGLRCRLQLPSARYFGERVVVRAKLMPTGEKKFALPFRDVSNDRIAIDFRYASVEVRCPDGKRFTFDPDQTVRHPERQVTPRNWRVVEVMTGGYWIESEPMFLAGSGPDWIDTESKKPATFSFKAPGDYEFRLTYAIAQNDAASSLGTKCWSGTIQSEWTRMRIEPLPPEKRRMETTAEQREWIRTLNVKQLSVAIHEAANEGLAIALIDDARKNPGKTGEILELVASRAIPKPGIDDEIAIDGSYLKAYVELLNEIGTGWFPDYPDPPNQPKGRIVPFDDLFRPCIAYALAHPEDKNVMQRLEWFAFNRANPWPDFPPGKPIDEAKRRSISATRLSQPVAWSILLDLKQLSPGLSDKTLRIKLGEPTTVRDGMMIWVQNSELAVRKALFVTVKDGKAEKYEIRQIRWQETAK